jgi:hypothetical protein
VTRVGVSCQPSGPGWSCAVNVGDDLAATRHEVAVSAEVLKRLAPGDVEPTRLVQASFDFLLAREPRESILRNFELEAIGRYFPEYEAELVERLAQ